MLQFGFYKSMCLSNILFMYQFSKSCVFLENNEDKF
jgi:hypothetical protein